MSEWNPDLPGSWGLGRVKSVAWRVTDGAHVSPDTDGGVFDFVSTRDLADGVIDFEGALKTTPETYEYMVRTGCRPRKGDVLFSKDGTVGETAVVQQNREFAVASSLVIVTPDPERLDSRFLNYVFRSKTAREQAASMMRGAGLPRLSVANLARIEVPIPPMLEQRAIADYLDRETAQIDTLIAKQDRLITTLRERSRSELELFASRFDGETIRMKRLFQPSSMTSKGGEEVLSVFRELGVVPKSSQEGNFNRTPEDVSRYLVVHTGDLVVNKMKAWQGSLGISQFGGIVSGDYEVARPISERLRSDFAHLYLRSPRLISEYAMRSTGIRPSQWRLYWDQLGEVEVIVPDPHVQANAVADLQKQQSAVNGLIAKAERFINLAKERRSALITAAVTGRIDVRAV